VNYKPRHHHIDAYARAISDSGVGSDDEMLSTPERATWFRCSTQWFEIGRSKGYGPPFVRLAPQVIRYKRGDVKAWLLPSVSTRQPPS
jgi:hypothetical protein